MLRSSVRLLGAARRRRGARGVRPRPRREPVRRVAPAARPGSVARGGEFWGWYDGGELRSAVLVGREPGAGRGDAEAVDVFADRARRQGRQCSSIVGPADAVLDPVGPARAVLGTGPRRPARAAADGDRRAARGAPPTRWCAQTAPEDLLVVTPACVAMFTEEVGYSPVAADGGALYHAQVAGLVSAADPSPGSRTARWCSRPSSAR